MSWWVSSGASRIISVATPPTFPPRFCRARCAASEAEGKMIRRFAFVAAFLIAACALAQETQPVSSEHLKAKVTGVEGIVQVRGSEDQPWQKATVGMEVG